MLHGKAAILLSIYFLVACGSLQRKVAVSYYDNGKKSQSFEYFLRNNKESGVLDTIRTGEWVVWDSLGNKVSESHYHDGVAVGIAKEFYRNGKVRILAYYINGKLDSSVRFLENGLMFEKNKYGINDTTFRYEADGTIDTTIGIKWLN